MIKNNAYGLGLIETAKFLDTIEHIHAFAVVKTDSAVNLREAGIKKPIHLMARFPHSDIKELAKLQIQPCLYTDDAEEVVKKYSKISNTQVSAQVYLDTGMSRMGIAYNKAADWMRDLHSTGKVNFRGAFMGFTEDSEYDKVQLQRFLNVTNEIQQQGIPIEKLHTASSSAVFEYTDAHLDMVRPGMALYGGYPNDPSLQKEKASLTSCINLKARVVRVDLLQKGDSVSYGRNYIANSPAWIATIPVGHTDGYPRKAVKGAQILIGNNTYPVIGAVSASHCIVEIGKQRMVNEGDIATLWGSSHPDIDPNQISSVTGTSIYDIFMHLNPTLPRVIM